MLKGVNPDTIKEMIVELVNGNQYSSVKLSDIMSYPVVTVDQDTLVEEVAMLLRDMGCTGMPVVDKDENLVGVISRRDFKKLESQIRCSHPSRPL